MAKICKINFWFGNDPPLPPLQKFSENSSVLEGRGFPKPSFTCAKKIHHNLPIIFDNLPMIYNNNGIAVLLSVCSPGFYWLASSCSLVLFTSTNVQEVQPEQGAWRVHPQGGLPNVWPPLPSLFYHSSPSLHLPLSPPPPPPPLLTGPFVLQRCC